MITIDKKHINFSDEEIENFIKMTFLDEFHKALENQTKETINGTGDVVPIGILRFANKEKKNESRINKNERCNQVNEHQGQN